MVKLLLAVGILLGSVVPRPALAQEDVLPPQIVHEPCEFYRAGVSYEVLARFYDDSPIFDPKVLYRPQGDDTWSTAPFKKNGDTENFVAVLETAESSGTLEYFIETFDENGNGPARFGSPDAPVQLRRSADPVACVQVGETEVAPATLETSRETSGADPRRRSANPPPTATRGELPSPVATGCDAPDAPVHCSGWFWGGMILGLAAVAGAVVGILAAFGIFETDECVPPQCGPSDFVTLDIVGADPTVAPILRW